MNVIKRSASKGGKGGPSSVVSGSSAGGGTNSLKLGDQSKISGRGSITNQSVSNSHYGGGGIQLGNLNIKSFTQKSVGGSSFVTSNSDLEKWNQIMIQAKHANKNFVKQFGKFLEDFRRENHCVMELILSDYN